MSVKSLNIDNTFRNDNYNTNLKHELLEEIVKVTRVTEEEVVKQLEEHDTKNKRYIMFAGHHENDTLNKQLFDAYVPISYYSDTVIPYQDLIGLQGNKQGEAVYNISPKFTKKQLKNIDLASSLCRTVVNTPVVYPDISPKKLVFSLSDVRYILNRVDLDFVTLTKAEVQGTNREPYYEKLDDNLYHLKAEVRMGYYLYMHEYLARWVIHLNLLCETPEYKNTLDNMRRK